MKTQLVSRSVSGRISWPVMFLLLNAAGVGIIVWQLRAIRRPSGEMVIVRTWPSEGEVSTELSEVKVEFGSRLDPDTLKDDSLGLIPCAVGKVSLCDDRTVRLRLTEKLDAATRYRIKLSPELRSVHGESPPKTPVFFTTPELRVIDVSQAKIERDRSTIIDFKFNSPVNPHELIEHLAMTYPDGKPLSFRPVGGRPDKSVQVSLPRPEWDKITVTISKGLAGTEGPLPLEEDYTTKVEVDSRLRFKKMIARHRRGRSRIEIRTNSPIDAAGAAPFVEIDPPVKHTFDESRSGLHIVGEFEPARRYSVTLKAGLPAGDAGTLEKDITRAVWFPDKPKQIAFALGGGYLSPNGLLKVPIRTTNEKRVKLSTQQLYENNLVEYALNTSQSLGMLGTSPAETEINVEGERNEEVETIIDLRRLLGENVRGVYALQIRSTQEYWRRDRAVVVVTDLGISARLSKDDALVWVTSLSSARPVAGVRVDLYSDRRQKIASTTTDDDGLAIIRCGAAFPGCKFINRQAESLPHMAKDEKPALITASKGEDLCYLHLPSNERSRGKGSASGRSYLSRGYEVFVFPERGAYRPGDTARISAFVRGVEWHTPAPMPLELVVGKHGRRDLLRKTVLSDAAGRLLADVEIPNSAPSGRYSVTYRLPADKEALGSTTFLVADYIPQTLRMKLEAPGEPLPASEPFDVKVHVEHLFGDPARGLAVKCNANFSARGFHPDGWKGYVFGDWRSRSKSVRLNIPGDKKLDGKGNATFKIEVPKISTPATILADLGVEVLEPGGRALTRRISRTTCPWRFYLGAKAPDDPVVPGGTATFSLAAVGPGGAAYPKAGAFTASLYRVTYSNVLRRAGDGRLEYEWRRKEKLVTKTEGDFAGGPAEVSLAVEHPGPHRLIVESKDGCTATYDFHVNGPGARWAMADPEELDLRLDRKTYRPGDVAKLRIRGPFGGTALLCVESDRVLHRRVVELLDGEGEAEFTVQPGWRPNVYLTAAVVRPVGPEEEWRPHRAAGVARLNVDCKDRQLAVEVQSPNKIRPGGNIDVAIRVSNGAVPESGAAVVFAAVDEGVLALTRHRTPSPWDFFYSHRWLAVREFDMFSRLAPELAAWKLGKKAEPGGDEGLGAEFARRLNPIQARRVKTAVLYAGALTTDDKGIARASFVVPEYIGELRIMAAVAGDGAFGNAEKALPVKSPVMARASWPRFLAPGDQFDVPVTLFNRTANGGAISVELSGSDHIRPADTRPVEAEVSAGGEKTVAVRMRTGDIGKANIRLTARLGDESYSESLEIPVRPAAAFDHRAGSVVVDAGVERAITIGGDFLPSTAKCSLVVAGTPTVELSGAVEYLLRYPYGCVEQTASKMVPLIYLGDLAALSQPGLVGAEEIEDLLYGGCVQLKMMQTYNGALAGWPGGSKPYPWGSLYAADLLVEARKAGHEVPNDLLDPLLSYITSRLRKWATAADKEGNPTMFGQAAYACYILARSGSPSYAWMAGLEETLRRCDNTGKNLPATARCHLAAAYLAAGQKKVAKDFIAGARSTAKVRQTGGYLDSPVREAAVMLLVLLDLEPESVQIAALAERLRKNLRVGRWGTTQENAFALMALGKYARRLAGEIDPDATVTVMLPDRTRTCKAKEGLHIDDLKPGTPIRVKFEGKGRVFAFWNAEGVPRSGKTDEKDSGLAIRRSFYEADGKTLADPESLVQGKLYQVSLLMVQANHDLANIVIADLLPAGLEIENTSLCGTAEFRKHYNHARLRAEHVERRDDRLLVFGNTSGGRREFRYLVRAVTAGTFVLPAAEVSCMYDPDLYSVHGGGKVRVKRQ